jgi:hypothetical protein
LFDVIFSFQIIEEWMFQCLNCTYSLFRYLFPHFLQQVNAFMRQQFCDSILQFVILFPLRETLFVVREILNAWPGCIIRRAFPLEYLKYLVNLRVTLEEWFPVRHFDHDAARRPYVHTEVLPLLAHQDFGRPLPQGDDFVRQGLERQFETAGQAEVAYLDVLGVVVDEHVLWLEIAVHNAAFVALDQ